MKIALLLLLLLLLSCSNNSAGGPGGQTTNGIVAEIADENHAGTYRVTLRPLEYAPNDPLYTQPNLPINGATKECSSRFMIENILPGSYIMEIRAAETLATIDTFTIIDDTTLLDRGVLQLDTTGSISGQIDPLKITEYDSVRLYIKGVEREIPLNSDGTFQVANLAPWRYRFVTTAYDNEESYSHQKMVTVTEKGNSVIIPLLSHIDSAQYSAVRQFLDALLLPELSVEEVVTVRQGEIEELSLINKELTTLPDMSGLTFLKRVRLDSNAIAILPESLGDLTNLLSLSVAHNTVTKLHTTLYKNSALTSLDISHNQINELPPDIKALTKLKVLEMASNMINTIPDEISFCSFLTIFNAENNEITTIPADFHTSFVMLLDVNLTFNRIDPTTLSDELKQWLTGYHENKNWLDTQK